MDSLNPADPLVAVTSTPRPPRIWKFWGTSQWGLFVFAAMFAGQFLLVAAFFVARGPPFDLESLKTVPAGR